AGPTAAVIAISLPGPARRCPAAPPIQPRAPASPVDNRRAKGSRPGSRPPAAVPENSSSIPIRRCRMSELIEITGPVEARTRIGLAPRGDVFMAGDTPAADQRKGPLQSTGQGHQAGILLFGIGLVVGAFQFDAQGEVIAVLPPLEARLAGMPGAVQTGNKLGHRPVTLDEKVGRYPQLGNLGKIRVGISIEGAGEKLLDTTGTELARRQADIVNHQQRDSGPLGTAVEMGRRALPYPVQPTIGHVTVHESPRQQNHYDRGRAGADVNLSDAAGGAGCRSPTPAPGQTADRPPAGGSAGAGNGEPARWR